MTKQSKTLSKVNTIPEFGTEPGFTFHGKVVSPTHTPCWCIKPSEIDIDATMFEKLHECEAEYLKQGKQLWIVSFEEKCSSALNPFSFLLSDANLERPSTEQLSRLENWYASINYGVDKVKAEYLEDY